MPLPQLLAAPIDAFRSRARELSDQARVETQELVAQLSGRGADWIDESGHVLADRAAATTTHLTAAAGQHVDRMAGRVAGAIGRWSMSLGDRMVRLGEELGPPRPRD